jgi:hydroxymethylglutaryl-CoA lyase
MLQGMGIETGINLDKLIEAGNMISATLKKETRSKVGLAITRKNEKSSK